MPINWSNVDHRSLLGRVLRLPLRMLPKGMVMSIRRGPAKGMKWIVGSSNHGCWLGTYELEKQHILERFVRPGMTVYDIGAQAGFYTLFFSSLMGGAGRVYAFEPFAENVQHLLAHVATNRLPNVKVVQAAIGDRSCVGGFTVGRGKSENGIVTPHESLLRMPVLTIDEIIENHGFSSPDLVKLDVEGAESAVLEGARRTLDCYRPVVFVALHGGRQQEACRIMLESLGYEVRRLDGGRLTNGVQADEIYALPKARQHGKTIYVEARSDGSA